jgi:hypothetical protein
MRGKQCRVENLFGDFWVLVSNAKVQRVLSGGSFPIQELFYGDVF